MLMVLGVSIDGRMPTFVYTPLPSPWSVQSAPLENRRRRAILERWVKSTAMVMFAMMSAAACTQPPTVAPGGSPDSSTTQIGSETAVGGSAPVAPQSTSTAATHSVVMLAQFSGGPGAAGYIHVLDGTTLQALARIRAYDPATQLKPVPGGRQVLVAQASMEGGGAPTLFVLDVARNTMCRIEEPGVDFAPSADGQKAYNQQGTTPINVFDLGDTGSLVGTIDTGDTSLQLYPSPDGQWLVGAEYNEPVVKLFDTATLQEVDQVSVASDIGAWLGDAFYALGKEADDRILYRLAPPNLSAVAPLQLTQAGIALGAEANVGMVTAGTSLALYARITSGEMFSSRGDMPDDTPGGIFLLDPTSTSRARHLAADIDIADLAASPDGHRLYALEVANEAKPQLMSLNTATGAITEKRALSDLGDGRWAIAAAELTVPVPTGDIQPQSCPHAEASPFPTFAEPTPPTNG